MARTKYLPLREVADTYGVSTRTIRRRISDGTLPAVRVGSVLRVQADHVDRLARAVPTVAAK